MRKWFVIILVLPIYVFAQETAAIKNISYSVNYLGGKIFLHTPKIHVSEPPFCQAVEFSYKKQGLGNKDWQQRFGFPETALNFCIAKNGSSQLGYSFGIFPSIQFRLVTFKQGNWFWKFGGGIGIVTKHWKRLPYQDSMNNIIGGLVNNFSMFQTGIRFSIAKKWTLQTGLDFFHTSNASARQPNFGINTFGAFVGLNYHPNGFVNKFKKRELAPLKNSFNLGLRTAFGMAEDKIVDGPMFRMYNFSLFGSKMYRHKSRIIFGVDMTYNSKLYSLFKNNYNYVGSERKHALILTSFLGHEFVFGKIGFPVQFGYYFTRPIQGPYIYQKVGINYHFYHQENNWIKDIFLQTELKTHFAKAEYADIGLGILF